MTSALNISSIAGSNGGMILKPSAAPSLNQSSMMSATCSGVPATPKTPRGPATVSRKCPRRAVTEPVLDDVGDLLRRAGDAEMAACAGKVRQQLPQRRLLPPHQVQD